VVPGQAEKAQRNEVAAPTICPRRPATDQGKAHTGSYAHGVSRPIQSERGGENNEISRTCKFDRAAGTFVCTFRSREIDNFHGG
jgi:hypothetical protein